MNENVHVTEWASFNVTHCYEITLLALVMSWLKAVGLFGSVGIEKLISTTRFDNYVRLLDS